MIGSKGLQFSGFDVGHHGVVIKKFGEDRSKSLPMGLFFLENVLVVATTLALSKSPHLL